MKSTFWAVLCFVLMLAGVPVSAGTAGKKPHYPKAPGLTYLYTVNITGGDAYPVGPGPRGVRLVVPILKGSFSGPKLEGNSISTMA